MSLTARRVLPPPAPWLKDSLWRRARAVPSLDLRFADNKSLVDSVSGQNLITFTRASTATFVGSDGVLQTAATDAPRFDHNPTTGESLGLLVEEQRSNLLLNSATLSTQNVTVTAAAHTLSFTGTGTITLTGTSTAGPLVGTGTGEGNRVILTFTPTAGTLTLTVSGTVSNAQLEPGSFRTSYIPTTTSQVTRAADVATITGSNFSGWYRQDEGTFYGDAFRPFAVPAPDFPVIADARTGGDVVQIGYLTEGLAGGYVQVGGVVQAGLYPGSGSTRARKIAFAAAANNYAVACNGGAVVTNASGTMPAAMTSLQIGSVGPFQYLNGHIRRLTYFPTRLPNTTLQRITQ